MESNFPSQQEFNSLLKIQSLTGETGIFRAKQSDCLFGATNDYEAINFWLKNKVANKPNTLRVYQTQAERLLLWTILTKQKPISSLTHEDFQEYFKFLDNPSPKQIWCIDQEKITQKKLQGLKVARKRWQTDWRPFKGPLSSSAKGTAIHAICTMLNYWQEFGYLKTNILRMIDLSRYQDSAEKHKLTIGERVLNTEEWQAIMRTINKLPEATRELRLKKNRIYFLFMTLLVTACRRQEIVQLQWADFKKERNTWRLYVLGKGNKFAKITLPNSYIDIANQYRQSLSLGYLQSKNNESLPVFTHLSHFKPINGDTINRLVKETCQKASQYVACAESKNQLKLATAHWIRHTAATVLDHSGIDKSLIKTHLRHTNDSTTELYIHKNVDEMREALEALVNDHC